MRVFCVEIFGPKYIRPVGVRIMTRIDESMFSDEESIKGEAITCALTKYAEFHPEISSEDLARHQGPSQMSCDILEMVKANGFFSNREWRKVGGGFHILPEHLADIGKHNDATQARRDDLLHWYDLTDGSEDHHEEQIKKIDNAWDEAFPWEKKQKNE